MKMQFTVVAILALLGLGIAQDTVGIKPCASGCVNGVFANGPNIGCAANDLVCVCGKTTAFADGIHDCVMNACPAEDRDAQLPLAQSAGADQCKAASSSAGLLSSATPAPATSAATTPASVESQQAVATSTPVTEASAGTTASPVPTSSPASPTVAASSKSVFSVASASVDSTSAVVESSAASSPTSSATASEQSSTAGGAAASTETASAGTSNGNSSPTESGLSVAARAGIGAGAGVAVVLAAILAFCLISRRRKQNNAAATRIPTMQISEPLPGSGRQYADNVNTTKAGASLSKTFTPSPPRATSPTPAPYSPSSASYSSELDVHTQRYEDLLPRTQPHTMI